jgi:hypothetical protein
MHLLTIESQSRRKSIRLRNRQNLNRRKHLMYHLHITPRANPTLHDQQFTRRAHFFQDPLSLLKRLLRRTSHNRQRPIRRASRTPRNRRIDKENITPTYINQLRRHALNILTRYRGAQNQSRALRKSFHNALVAEKCGLGLWCGCYHDDVEGLVFCGFGERG